VVAAQGRAVLFFTSEGQRRLLWQSKLLRQLPRQQ
jgi:hypothetical protein